MSAPVAVAMHRLERSLGGVKGKRLVANGTETWTYTFPRQSSVELDTWVPADVYQAPWLGFSTVDSWAALARELRAIADRQLAAGPITLPPELTKGATLANARALTAWLQKKVRPTGVPVNAMPFLPTPPAETLRTGTANELSLAFALVALLQKADIPAELALVDVGAGPDAEPELAMYGWFDRAIVRARIGNADVWIDPTATAFRAGVLPWADRHRRVLVLARGATGLTAIPASAPTDNVVHETRTFEFPSNGGAHVTEVKREGGMFEGEDRAWFRDQSRDDIGKRFDQIVTKRYLVDKVAKWSTSDPDDLATPFEATIVVDGVGRALAERNAIDVWVFPSAALTMIPDAFRVKAAKRTTDFEWYRPHVYEVENRFVIPDGFELPAIAGEVRTLGTTKLTRTAKVAGQVLTLTYRFESGKLRLTPAELDATRAAMIPMLDEGFHIVFPSSVHALLDRGKAREAVTEARRLIQAHPKAGTFHAQLAEILTTLGLCEIARREARAAIQLEPNNADLHAVLGWVLLHDTVGRAYRWDHDAAGARAELQRARKLQPTHTGAAATLGEVLEHDLQGRMHEAGSDLAGSLVAWRAAYEREDNDANAEGVMRALLWTNAGAELAKFARSRPEGATRNGMLIAGVSIVSGGAAGLQEAGALTPESARKAAIAVAASILMYTRHYDEMRTLFEATNAFPRGSARAALMHAIHRADKPMDRKLPIGAVLEAAIDTANRDASKGYWDPQTEQEVGDDVRATLAQAKIVFPRATLADIVRSSTNGKVDGDSRGWRVDFELQGAHGATYAVQDRGVIKVIGTDTAVAGVGRHVLRLLAANDTATAQRLLDWVAKDGKRSQALLRAVWGPNHANDRATMEVAAAVLTGTTDPAHALPILENCEGAMGLAEVACAATVFSIDREALAWKALDATATARLAAKPDDRLGIEMKATAQLRLKNPQEAERLVDAGLAKMPDAVGLQHMRAEIPAVRGDLVESIKRYRALAATDKAALNEEAWLDLIANTDLADGLAKAQQAVQQFPTRASFHHTRAALEAEVGDLRDAVAELHEAMKLRSDPAPANEDWYVIGRIAEQLGYAGDAVAAYRRVKPVPKYAMPETYDLAQRRLAVLGTP